MTTLAFDTHKFVKELTAAGMKTEQAEVLASSYAKACSPTGSPPRTT